MSGDLPMHVLPTETNASQVAFFFQYDISAQGEKHSVLHSAEPVHIYN